MHDRGGERGELKQRLKSGTSIQVLAPRRVGKTWLIHRLAEDLNEEGWLAIVVDVEGMRSEAEFLRALCSKLQEKDPLHRKVFDHMAQRVRQVIEGEWSGNPFDAIARVNGKDFAESLIASLHEQERDTVIMIDEIALFVLSFMRDGPEAAHDFLYGLRRLARAYPRVRWLLTGSIGLDVVARRGNLQGALVDLHMFPLHPFDIVAARSYLDDLSDAGGIIRPFTVSDDDFAYLAEQLGWLAPYYLKLVADRVRPTGDADGKGRKRATRENIDAAFDELMQPHNRGSFAVWEEHIDKNFEPRETRLLQAIMSICCETPDGETEATLLARLNDRNLTVSRQELMILLTALSNDGALREHDARWMFQSGLLRRYWMRYWCE